MKFKFLKYPAIPCSAFPERNHGYRPMIDIHLWNTDLTQRVRYYALLDTGADYNLFHADLAELIGIRDVRNDKEQELFGIEGEGIKSYFHDIIIEAGGWKFKSYSGFTNFEGKRTLDKMPYGILGQVGFFEYFKVTFDYEKQEMEIKEKDTSIFIHGDNRATVTTRL